MPLLARGFIFTLDLVQVPDTLQQDKLLHRLDEVHMVVLCTTLRECDRFTEVEDLAQTQLAWLRSFWA